jgi:bifunctional UDP-N-acetylglucosamine pyrophosphorylase/glucosamine-1-phosphate N-acetyltransferase
MQLDVVVLAAGKGSRMKSQRPKVLHPIGGQPMLEHVFKQVDQLKPQQLLAVVGHGCEQVQMAIEQCCPSMPSLNWIQQQQQLGTGHAVAQCAPLLIKGGITLILYGDVPLIRRQTLEVMISTAQKSGFALLTQTLDNPKGFGRILRDSLGKVVGIIEHKDATEAQRAITEINTGIYACRTDALLNWLPKLTNDNAQQEYYITDIVALAVAEGYEITSINPECAWEVQGVNDRIQLAQLEKIYQRQRAKQLMLEGVSFADAERVTLRGDIQIEPDVFIEANVTLEGPISIEKDTYIGPNVHIRNSRLGRGVRVEANSVIEEASIEAACVLGPFARIRPNTQLKQGVKVGNFVEIKGSNIGEQSKVNHLSYIGNATLGRQVNVGAGTITCNYDGVNKFHTQIGDHAFIGSNTALVAPVSVAESATIAAGSTITDDVPAYQLGIARGRQSNKSNWQRPKKQTSDKE